MAELYDAAEEVSSDTEGVGGFRPFRSVSEVPLIKHEIEEEPTDDRQASNAFVYEENKEGQTEEEDQLSILRESQVDENATLVDDPQECYEYSWTGI